MAAKYGPYYFINRYVNGVFKRSGVHFRSIDLGNMHIEYWDSEDDKPPLLMLQAFAAESKYSWFRQIKKLRKNFRLIVPNLLYFGGSTMDPQEFNIANQVDAIERLLKHLNIDKMHIAAASYGAVVAMEFADKHPNRIVRMSMSNGPLKYWEERDLDILMEEFGVDKKEEFLIPASPQNLKRLFNICYHRKLPIPLFVFRNIFELMYSQQRDEKKKLITASNEELDTLKEKDYNFPFPVLLLWGERDKLAPLKIAKQLKDHLGDNTRLEIIPKTEHMPNYEKPRKYNKILYDFLTGA